MKSLLVRNFPIVFPPGYAMQNKLIEHMKIRMYVSFMV